MGMSFFPLVTRGKNFQKLFPLVSPTKVGEKNCDRIFYFISLILGGEEWERRREEKERFKKTKNSLK